MIVHLAVQSPTQCYFVHRHLNNDWYHNTSSLIGEPYLAIIVSNVLLLFCFVFFSYVNVTNCGKVIMVRYLPLLALTTSQLTSQVRRWRWTCAAWHAAHDTTEVPSDSPPEVRNCTYMAANTTSILQRSNIFRRFIGNNLRWEWNCLEHSQNPYYAVYFWSENNWQCTNNYFWSLIGLLIIKM